MTFIFLLMVLAILGLMVKLVFKMAIWTVLVGVGIVAAVYMLSVLNLIF